MRTGSGLAGPQVLTLPRDSQGWGCPLGTPQHQRWCRWNRAGATALGDTCQAERDRGRRRAGRHTNRGEVLPASEERVTPNLGVVSDAGVTLDLGVVSDAGVPSDSGVTSNTGVTSDTGALADKLPFLGPTERVRRTSNPEAVGRGSSLQGPEDPTHTSALEVPRQRSDRCSTPAPSPPPRAQPSSVKSLVSQ